MVFVFVLKFDEIGNFGAARSAPGGPKIQENDFALGAGKRDGLAVESRKPKVRRGIGVAHKSDAGLPVLGRRKRGKEAQE